MNSLKVIGINSGTSLDGVDASLCEITRSSANNFKIQFIKGIVFPYEIAFKNNLASILGFKKIDLDELCLLNAALGDYFYKAVEALLIACKLSINDCHLIGSHGQTIWHSPNPKYYYGNLTSGTLQLGDPSILAHKTKLPVVCDFRPQDVSAGGQGAPLVAFLDKVLFGDNKIASGILNIGGIANLTALDETGKIQAAFDTGPGNMLIDYACLKLYNKEYDHDGLIAGSTVYDANSLENLLTHNYLTIKPPKTTGREEFGYSYANSIIEQLIHNGLSKQTVISTLTAFTAKSIAKSYETFILPKCKINRLILAGGGTYNKTLVSLMQNFWPHKIVIHLHDEFHIPIKYKEAVLFALLAYTRYYKIPNNVPEATGANQAVCMGKLIEPAS